MTTPRAATRKPTTWRRHRVSGPAPEREQGPARRLAAGRQRRNSRGRGCRIRGLSELHRLGGFDTPPDCSLLAIVLVATYLNRGCRPRPDRPSTARQPTPCDRGSPMIKFYYHPSPNPAKVALFLEESGLPYELMPVDTRKGEQFKPAFLAINPNGKTPAIVDGDVTVFDS